MNENKIPQLIFSFDFEIGWGNVWNGAWRPRQERGVYDRLRTLFPKLLRELDATEIPCTWATVGAMIENPANRKLDHLPPAMADDIHTALSVARENTFLGRDLFESVLSTNVKHDIACHSYSHIPWTHPEVSLNYIKGELSGHKEAIREYGLKTDRIVFPENKSGYEGTLEEMGYRVVRGDPLLSHKTRLSYLLSTFYTPPPMVGETKISDSLTVHHASMLFQSGRHRLHRLPFVYRRARSGLNYVTTRGGVLHIWMHPFTFAESYGQLPAFLLFCRDVAKARDKGLLEIAVM